jgi:hypothetical protein
MSPEKIKAEIKRLNAVRADAEAQTAAVQKRMCKDLEQLEQLRKYSRRDTALRLLRNLYLWRRVTRSTGNRKRIVWGNA